jgi:hypothetical protein
LNGEHVNEYLAISKMHAQYGCLLSIYFSEAQFMALLAKYFTKYWRFGAFCESAARADEALFFAVAKCDRSAPWICVKNGDFQRKSAPKICEPPRCNAVNNLSRVGRVGSAAGDEKPVPSGKFREKYHCLAKTAPRLS